MKTRKKKMLCIINYLYYFLKILTFYKSQFFSKDSPFKHRENSEKRKKKSIRGM